uniref:Uncharacterized protein n=1 Tax=Ixodes ricinus TaxID=34613 RepID=A0A6B0TQW5_IXORI
MGGSGGTPVWLPLRRRAFAASSFSGRWSLSDPCPSLGEWRSWLGSTRWSRLLSPTWPGCPHCCPAPL